MHLLPRARARPAIQRLMAGICGVVRSGYGWVCPRTTPRVGYEEDCEPEVVSALEHLEIQRDGVMKTRKGLV